ncbi:aminomethyl-transferring glycine dehydrogenase subunit GcvPB [Hujiaoplasma nucleasis]|uniref:Probable glycine dehydrogenase (decarboxylating) subunit 2 n=1 Tax=Hujiaoplasma nucleasis TaxID=2725268 RepID=A0A7L6MZV3_9MOLU|nr:aminomethyl-transferring glycine dehydrogenase subunit GcvPB [Hujiaoplasma nucleasis]QLY39520.1 aminomethyl-transferring glycine dehydrogenase subunit GcvPB [Hujiaoplasma nucleasis]
MIAYKKLIFELSKEDRVGYSLPPSRFTDYSIEDLSNSFKRESDLLLPEVSELDVLRHFTNISNKNFGVENGFYPLGSCTMKYNPKINEEIASLRAFRRLHPLQPISTVQGALKVYYELQKILSEVSGLHEFTLNSYAGAHGELVGLMVIKKYHEANQDFKRNKIIIPDSAHGTNPASVVVCGMEVIEIKSNERGRVSIDALKEAVKDRDDIAGMMLTNPNTLGIFEDDICEITKIIHQAGGLMYYDGANLNALLGKVRPGDMGFDVMHINLHKTFSTPHGGGGPGSGPVGVTKELAEYLPNPRIKKIEDHYYIENNGDAIGQISGFYGNYMIALRAYVYLLTLGKENIKLIGPYATLNANYIKEQLKSLYQLPIDGNCMHEVVFNGLVDKDTEVKTLDIAKRLLDYGMHAPTIYFPLLFPQAIMIEPTETESLQTMDEFISVMKDIAIEAKEHPERLKEAPTKTPIRRTDEVFAAKEMIFSYKDYLEYREKREE